jgi:hypothetical protein
MLEPIVDDIPWKVAAPNSNTVLKTSSSNGTAYTSMHPITPQNNKKRKDITPEKENKPKKTQLKSSGNVNTNLNNMNINTQGLVSKLYYE